MKNFILFIKKNIYKFVVYKKSFFLWVNFLCGNFFNCLFDFWCNFLVGNFFDNFFWCNSFFWCYMFFGWGSFFDCSGSNWNNNNWSSNNWFGCFFCWCGNFLGNYFFSDVFLCDFFGHFNSFFFKF